MVLVDGRFNSRGFRQRLQMLRRANHSLSAPFLEGVPLSATCMLGARETKMLPGVHNTGKWGSVDSQPPLIEESTSRDSAKQRTTYAAEVRRGASGLMALEDLYNAGSFVASQMAFRSPSFLPLAQAPLPFPWPISRQSEPWTRCILPVGLSLHQLPPTATLKMSSYTIEVVPFASYDWTFEKAGWVNLK